jgi:hypothetical protein
MITALCIGAALAALGTAYLVLRPVARAYLGLRGTRVVTCPETGKPVAIEVDARHAAVTAASGRPHLRLRDCSRWPERRGCGQECLRQAEEAPEDCLARVMLARWYAGKACVYCGKPFEVDGWGHKPALMNAGGRTFEWHEVRPEALPEVLATHLPVCWDCHIAETFRREHPELVTDRPGSE